MGGGICSRIRYYYSDTVLAYRGALSDDTSSMFTLLCCMHMYVYDGQLVCVVCCVLQSVQWWVCPRGVCGCVSLPLQSGGRAGTEESPATGSVAATTATKATTPTVSTCCHSYSPMCSRNAIYCILPLVVETVVIDLVPWS